MKLCKGRPIETQLPRGTEVTETLTGVDMKHSALFTAC